MVLDPISGEYSARSLRVLRPGGLLVSLLPFAPDIPAQAAEAGLRAGFMLVEHDQAGMNAIAGLVGRRPAAPGHRRHVPAGQRG